MKWKIILFFTSCLLWVSCLPSGDDITITDNEDNDDDVEIIDGKTKEEYFDFKTSSDDKIILNYDLSDYSIDFSIYIEDPINHNPTASNPNMLLEGIDPIIAGFTDLNGYFEGSVSLPSYVDTVYIVTQSIGLMPYIVVPVNDNKIEYDASTVQTRSGINTRSNAIATRADETYSIGSNLIKWSDATSDQGPLYALFDTFENPDWGYSTIANSKASNVYREITSDKDEVINGFSYKKLISPMNKYYNTHNNLGYKVARKSYEEALSGNMDDYYTIRVSGTDPAEIDAIMYASGNFVSTLAYYFYPTNIKMTDDDIRKLPKYIMYPNTGWQSGTKALVRLQFITEENGVMTGSSLFPPGYTIGFMEMSRTSISRNSGSGLDAYKATAIESYNANRTSYSNIAKMQFGELEPGSLVFADNKSDGFFFGFEDFFSLGNMDQQSTYNYSDPLIYVYSNPSSAIQSSLLPQPTDPEPEVLLESTYEGLILFEDKWPSLGDYDMNDAMIGYKTVYTVNSQNKVTSIEDTFTPLNATATYNNAFGFIYNDDGVVDAAASSADIVKEGTKQYLIIPNLNALNNQTSFTIKRTLSNLSLSDYKSDYNYYVVPHFEDEPATNRKEIHLPKADMTPLGDKSLVGTGNDAWFISKDGSYPFAIMLDGVKSEDFTPIDEGVKIGSSNNYPLYEGWVKDSSTNKDWYLRKTE